MNETSTQFGALAESDGCEYGEDGQVLACPVNADPNKRTVPAKALSCSGEFELNEKMGHEEKNNKHAPFKMVARSGGAIDHWFFGHAIHDMDGMKLGDRNRIAVDWMHDPEHMIGFANKFETDTDGNLVLSGAVISTLEGDKASEIIAQSRAGIPFEASIQFTARMPGDIKIQELGADEIAEVNGRSVEGPATIFREWPLVRVAICPSGADANTATALKENENADVELEVLRTGGDDMNDKSRLDAEQSEGVSNDTQMDADAEANGDTDGADNAAAGVGEESGESSEPQLDASESVDDGKIDRPEFCQFVERFGNDAAARFYAEGLGLDDATVKHNAELRSRVDELEAGQPSKDGEPGDGLDFDPTADAAEVTLTADEEQGARANAKAFGKTEAQAVAAKLARKKAKAQE